MAVTLLLSMIIFMAIGVPVAVAMGLGTVLAVVTGGKYDVVAVFHRAISGADSYTLLAVPFFTLAGQLMNSGGITKKIFRFASAMVGFIPGGLAHANVLASIIFSGMSGSAVADVGGLGQIEMEAMEAEGYDPYFSAAVTASSATIGPIIPPSVPMVIFAVLSETSVGRLFMGGIIPGLLMGIACMVVIYFISKARNYPKHDRFDLGEAWAAFKEAFFPLLTPAIIIGGMFSGMFSPTEASCVATVYALLLGIFYGEVNFKGFFKNCLEAASTTGVAIFIVCFSTSFAWVFAVEGYAKKVVEVMLNITSNPYVMLMVLNIIFLILGMLLPTTSILVIVVPFLLPLIESMGFNLVHIGVVLVLNLMVGMCTPPVGMSLFICAKISNVKLEVLYKEIWPMILPLVFVLLLITYIPDLVLWIPNTFM